ncbi:MAG: PAS-domain containing protein [Pseudomonadota bacterium]
MTDPEPAATQAIVSTQSLIRFCGRHGEGVLVWDQSNRLMGANDQAAKLLRVPEAYLATGLTMADLRDRLIEGPLGDVGGELFPSDLSDIAWSSVDEFDADDMVLDDPSPDIRRETYGLSTSFCTMGGDLVVTLVHQEGSISNAVAALARQNLYLSTVLENVTEGVVMVDAEHRIIASNKRYREMLGMDEQCYYTGMSAIEFAMNHGDLRDLPTEERRRIAKERIAFMSDDGDGSRMVVKNRKASDGRAFEFTRTILPGDDVIVTVRDKTSEDQLRHQRELLRTLIDSIEDGVSLLSKEGTHEVYNNQFLELLGIDPDTVSTGMHLLEFFRQSSDYRDLPPEIAETEMRRRADAAIYEKRPYVEYERALVNGRTINIRRTQLEQGDAVYMYRDITQEKERARLLEQARQDAEDANRLKSDFIARVSHELRTPMHGVLGMAELIRQSPLNDNQTRCLDVLCRSGRHMVDLIDGLLAISTIETGEIVLEPEATDLAALLSDCVDMIRPRAEQKKLQLSLDHDLSMGSVAMIDGLRLSQVVINLITNAVKYTQTGRIDVTAHATRDEGDLVLHIDIMDTGCGIAPEELAAIFEKFKQIRAKSGGMVEGVGLGLSIAQSLIDLMGGRLYATSVPDQGSTFSIEVRAPAVTGSAGHTDLSHVSAGRTA